MRDVGNSGAAREKLSATSKLNSSYLHVSALTVAGVEQSADLEFVELDAQYPILWRSSKGAEAVPAGHGLAQVFRSHLWT